MNEYDVSFYSAQDGGYVLDIHTTTGTSPYLRFPTVEGITGFFASLGISGEGLAEIEKICSNLQPRHGYHEKMFLPECVLDAMEKAILESGVDGQFPSPPPAVQSREQHA